MSKGHSARVSILRLRSVQAKIEVQSLIELHETWVETEEWGS